MENVVRNATRYTTEGTTVEVRLERQRAANGDEEIIVRVLDCGPGVPDEALPKIFEPFYRLDDARNRQTGGAGLGLVDCGSGDQAARRATSCIQPQRGWVTGGNPDSGGFRLFRGLLFPLIPDTQINVRKSMFVN